MGIKHSISWFEWKPSQRGKSSNNYLHKISPKYNHNWTELHYAASHGSLSKLKEVLNSQGTSDINRKDYYGKTPLYWAAYKGHAECIEELLDNGAEVNSQCKHGATPLHAVSGLYPHCTLLLIKKGADVDKEDKWGVTPMYIAACNGQVECINLLVSAGANFTYRNRKTGFLPKQLTEHKEYLDWLKNQSQTPRPLKELCRKVIRKNLGHEHLDAVVTFDVPSSLHAYILLEELKIP
ncbi:ankyrin repeat and SOCS box protein 8-like [Ptychodera flava]|uniref:ankyrin repeat and SOCS box protein 8-like n=1 Tax=Ptychodera flava TaxID=63121 RepID=UPI00396A5F88